MMMGGKIKNMSIIKNIKCPLCDWVCENSFTPDGLTERGLDLANRASLEMLWKELGKHIYEKHNK